jgi:macrolide transport system ATP-binding/permease protein
VYWLRFMRTRLRGLLRKDALERDMEDELRFHLLMRERENAGRGLAPDDARYAAVRSFGNVESIKERCRDIRGGGMVETLLRDMRVAVRRMAKSPGFTTVAIVSLALGIGANTAIFSLVDAVMLRAPAMVDRPGELFAVHPVGKDDDVLAFSYPNFVEFRDRNDILSGLTVARPMPLNLTTPSGSERIWASEVSGNYFDVLGVRVPIGRAFLPEEDSVPLRNPVAVLSHACWQRRFAADPGIIGRTIPLNGHAFTVVGVAPEGFSGTEVVYEPELWVPSMMRAWTDPLNRQLDNRGLQNLFATGRLADGVTVEQAKASLDVLAAQLGREYPETNEGQTIKLTPPGLLHPLLRDPAIGFTAILMGAVGLVLLIACTNLANLLLGRAAERRREVAVRLALGASRARLVAQLLTESVLLAVAAGAVGLLLAQVLLGIVAAARPDVGVPFWIDLRVDGRVLAFSMLGSIVTGIAFGLVPALQSTKPELVPALKDATSQSGHGRARLRSALVVAQVALSLVMLVAAGLVVRTLQHLQSMSPGFDPEHALMVSVDPALQGYDEVRSEQFYRTLVDRVRSTTRVESAALTAAVPLGFNISFSGIYVEGAPPVRGVEAPMAMTARVGPGYFETMRIPLLAGREFEDRDLDGEERVVVVNETFVRRFFPGTANAADAIGKRISYEAASGPYFEIAGVAKDGKYLSIAEEDKPFLYARLSRDYAGGTTLLVRTSADPESMIGPIRAVVRQLDPTLPVYHAKTMRQHLSLSLFPSRVAAALLGGFGLLALVLAAVGVYGVVAYSVAQRTREIGIRMALGARPGDVLTMVVRQGMVMAAAGLLAGLAGALAVTRLLESLLYEVSATDVGTYTVVSALLALVVLVACVVPAWRAAKVDPVRALRCDF